MNIVIVTDFAYVNGGASRIALGSALALAAAGEKVFLFTAVGPIAPELRGVRGLTVICTEQYEILMDPNRIRSAIQGLWNHKAHRMMTEMLDALDPTDTVIHVHLWAKALSSSVVRAAVKGGFQVSLTLHDFLAVCPNGTLFDHSTQQICQRRPMSLDCLRTHCDARKYSHKMWRVGRQAVQGSVGLLPERINHFIAISDLSEAVMRPYLPPDASLHRISNFIDIPKEARVDVARNSNFVYAGRLQREKGVLLWAECARKLNERSVFIGDGDLGAELRVRYADMHVTGWLSSTDTMKQMRSARALVFPSLWYETQGLVVAEAAAMGIPCVVSDKSAAREWVADGETGLWFRSGDESDLARKVNMLRESDEFAERLGCEAFRRYWKRPATIERHVQDLLQVYSAILAEHEPAPL